MRSVSSGRVNPSDDWWKTLERCSIILLTLGAWEGTDDPAPKNSIVDSGCMSWIKVRRSVGIFYPLHAQTLVNPIIRLIRRGRKQHELWHGLQILVCTKRSSTFRPNLYAALRGQASPFNTWPRLVLLARGGPQYLERSYPQSRGQARLKRMQACLLHGLDHRGEKKRLRSSRSHGPDGASTALKGGEAVRQIDFCD
jgi:hypothetical protein